MVVVADVGIACAVVEIAAGRPLRAQDAVQQEALGQVGEARVACPQESSTGYLERVVLGARLLRLEAVEELRKTRQAPLRFCAIKKIQRLVGGQTA